MSQIYYRRIENKRTNKATKRKEVDKMTVKMTNATNYANIYSLTDDNGKVIGTKEVRLAGSDVKTYYASWSHYSKQEIKKLFKSI